MLKVLIFATILACVYAEAQKQAIVILKADGLSGKITFSQTGSSEVTISGTISGLSEGKHGFHIHQKGDLSDGCTSTGAHFNPENKTHGAPSDATRHVGDLGNIVANASKIATINIKDKVISLDGANNIIGRAVVVHADPDDFGKGGNNDSLTTGHAGARLACGIIGILSENAAGFSTSSIFLLSIPFLLLTFNYHQL